MKYTNTTSSKENYAITLRFDSRMHQMVEYLKERKLLSKSAILKLALSELYYNEIKGEINND